MIRAGRLTSTGISVNDACSYVCTPCLGPRLTEIRYWDIVSAQTQTEDIVDVTYLSRASRPFQLKSVLLRIVAVSGRHGSQEHLTGSGEAEDDAADDDTLRLGDKILRCAYAGVGLPQDRARTLVLVNPHSGPGNAKMLYERHAAPLFAAAGLATTVVTTERAGGATEMARTLALEDYGSIVCVSGDGLPHEVINGLAAREDGAQALAHFALAQLPGGSGNAMCLSLNNGENDWAAVALGIVKGAPEPVDLMVLTQGTSTLYSFLSQSYGIVADCDLGTEDWRWMGGARFTVGIVLKCVAASKYPCEIAYEEVGASAPAPPAAPASLRPRLSVRDPVPASWTSEKHHDLSMFYVGKMQWMSYDAHVFPAAESLDGAMDMLVWDTSFGPLKALQALTKFESGQHMGLVPFYKKVSAYRITPLVDDNYVSIDGESYPCEPFQAEVLCGSARFITPIEP